MDLAGDGWPNRPPLSAAPAWALDEAYCGRSRAEKLAQIRRLLSERKADVLLLSSLDDIAWLLNLRGGDVACCPVVLSFLALTASDTQLFVNPSVLPEALKNALAADGITLAPYDGIYAYAAALPAHSTVWLDEEKTSCALWRAAAHCPIVSAANPTLLPKAIKNAAEIANERTAHLRDGAALTQWIFWLKATVGRSLVTERSAAEKLEALRARQPHYLEPSFDPIVAYGSHGAIVHYSATEESDIPLEPQGFLLSGHRRSLSRRHHGRNPHHCPRTCVGRHEAPLHAGAAQPPAPAPRSVPVRLPWQCPGHDRPPASMAGKAWITTMAPATAWDISSASTRGRNSFRFRSAGQDAVLESGMILSDEPGLYLEGRYGIRLENLLVCEERFEMNTAASWAFLPDHGTL